MTRFRLDIMEDAISVEARKKALEMDVKEKRREDKVKIINQQIIFAIEYGICPVCSNNLKGINSFAILFNFCPKYYCKKCDRIFTYNDIEEDEFY